eukprot:TRINITY_DN26056_c0_g1_i1.p2 TRINITY_DN26056_c0_g1~~TRINITY_DN26056_c0_g1_i1.p2  ORF type:complete len:186 (-),score=17.74 TRINITY_DN26056_c0_g1_i1:537-1094(-)
MGKIKVSKQEMKSNGRNTKNRNEQILNLFTQRRNIHKRRLLLEENQPQGGRAGNAVLSFVEQESALDEIQTKWSEIKLGLYSWRYATLEPDYCSLNMTKSFKEGEKNKKMLTYVPYLKKEKCQISTEGQERNEYPWLQSQKEKERACYQQKKNSPDCGSGSKGKNCCIRQQGEKSHTGADSKQGG